MNDAHRDTWIAETTQPAGDRAWIAWAHEAERLAGQSIDGDRQATNPAPDRYSIDDAYEAWKAGDSPATYVQRTPEPTAAEEAAHDEQVEREIAAHEIRVFDSLED